MPLLSLFEGLCPIFEKISGKVSGTNRTDTGIYIPNAQVLEFPRVRILIVFHLVSSKSLMFNHIPEFEVNSENINLTSKIHLADAVLWEILFFRKKKTS